MSTLTNFEIYHQHHHVIENGYVIVADDIVTIYCVSLHHPVIKSDNKRFITGASLWGLLRTTASNLFVTMTEPICLSIVKRTSDTDLDEAVIQHFRITQEQYAKFWEFGETVKADFDWKKEGF